MLGVRGEHFVLLLGIVVVLFALAPSGRPPEPFLIAGLVLVAFGLFRRQLRRVKAGPSSIELAIDQALGTSAAEPAAAVVDAARAEVAEQLHAPTQPGDIRLLISAGLPVGGVEAIMGSDHIVQATAVNVSDRPIGLSSIGLRLDDRRWIPGLDTLPSNDNIRLPAILEPQEQATVWWDYDSLRSLLGREGGRIQSIVANLRDGTEREQPVPAEWHAL